MKGTSGLPSTRDLARTHGVSQATATRALADAGKTPVLPAQRPPSTVKGATSGSPTPRAAGAASGRRELLSDRLYRLLRREIVSGRLAPGQRVVESEVARVFGTSQAPAREAIRRLAQEGLVTHRPHLGSFVSTVSAGEAREARDVRVIIESAAARRAAGQLDPDRLTALRRAVADMERAARCDDVGAFREADLMFHRTVCAASGNSTLLRVWQTLEPTLWNLHVVSDALFEGDRELLARCHTPLVEALAAGRAEQAARLFTEHARGEGWLAGRSHLRTRAAR